MSTPPGHIITSINNQRIVDARKLQTQKHRQRQGCFLVEGFEILHLALDAGLQPVEAFYCEQQCRETATQQLLNRFREADATLVAVSPQVLHSLSAAAGNVYADHRKVSPHVIQTHIVATFSLFETSFQDINLAGDELVLVLDQTQTPGNLGMILRTADAVGVAAIFLIPPCVDIFHPKSVRGSHGSLFSVPLVQTVDIPGVFGWLRERGFRTMGTHPHLGKLWNQQIWKGKVALVLGHDVRGISDAVRAEVEDWARLPMMGKVESLNVAVAGSVLIYEWFRVNRLDNVSL
jgi:TrmH family RNA methyltransferase